MDGQLSVAKQLGNYRVIRLLGAGGFGEVYLGEHVYLKTPAALKVLDARLSESALERFLTEARVVAHLDHPHIVRVLDFGIQGEVPYLVMHYAPHGTIRRRYPRGTRVPLPQVIESVNQIAASLQYAHNLGVIHRDVKPENILVDARGQALLSDFGLAIIIQNDARLVPRLRAGTVSYMAPEQVSGRPERASDQYALAIVAYEWLGGNPPFRGSPAEIALHHAHSIPPALNGIPVEIEAIIMRALAKDPAARFPSIEAFAQALERAYRAHHPQPPVTPRLIDDAHDQTSWPFQTIFSDANTLAAEPSVTVTPDPAETGHPRGVLSPNSFPQTSSPVSPRTSSHAFQSEPHTSAFPSFPDAQQSPPSGEVAVDQAVPDQALKAELVKMPDNAIAPEKPETSSQKKTVSRRRVAAVLFGIAALGGGSAWYLLNQSSPTTRTDTSRHTNQTTQSSNGHTPQNTPAGTPDNTQKTPQATSQPGTTPTSTPDAQQSPGTNPSGTPASTAQATSPAGQTTPTATAQTPTPTPEPSLTIRIETGLLPAKLVYGNTYNVTVTTSVPGASVTLDATYVVFSETQHLGTQVAGSDGRAVFSWQIKSDGVLTGLLELVVKLNASASTAGRQQAATEATVVVALL